MSRRHLIALLSLLVAVAVTPARASDDPQPGTPEWQARDAENMAYATGRQQDMLTNPAFGHTYWTETIRVTGENVADQLQHPDRPIVSLSRVLPGETADPYRQQWNGQRGVMVPIDFINDCGARISGSVWGPKVGAPDPITGAPMSGPFPGIVITTGSIQGYEEMYWWAAQGLAEAGYVAMTWDVMGQGESDAACRDGSSATGFSQGTLDALDWFLSTDNPLRGWVDDTRLGLAGHSAGASATGAFAQQDERIDAVVGWDSISIGASITPRVPTMSQVAEYFFNPTPATSPPNPEGKRAWLSRFETAGVPAYHVAHRGSTHLEWTFVPYILPASRDGERVAMYYTLAWFDRYIRGITEPAVATDARARLLATTFDGSSDRSSIGAGSWDPATNTNVPYTIGGETVADHLSIYLRSSYAFDGFACADMRAGC